MQVIINALAREGAKGVYTPNTLWPASRPVTIEVVDADDDPPCDRRTTKTPGIEAFDGYQIGRKTLALLKGTPGITVVGTDGQNAVDVTAAFGAAEKAWSAEKARLTARVDELTAECARLRPLDATIREQEQTIADLRARLRALDAKPAAAPQPQQGQQRRV